MKYKDILQNKEVKAFLKKGNDNLGILGYTDHSEKHCVIVAKRVRMILKKFGYSEHEISTGGAVDAVSAALILADKTDIRRNRVRKCTETFYYIKSAN